MRRQLRKGENVSDASERWKSESLRQKIRERVEQSKKELKKSRKPKLVMNPSLPKLPLLSLPLMDYVQGDKKLSILICTIVGREDKLQSLLNLLEVQKTDEVEILVEKDNKEITIGGKRNILLERAVGDYVAFIDDDDKVSNDYVVKILNAISTSPDCCGMEGEITRRIWIGEKDTKRRRIKTRTRKFIHSIQYDRWFQRNKIYYRCPNHLNPIKRELALRVKFPKQNLKEDRNFSIRIRCLLKTEIYIKGVIYFYLA